VRNAVDLPKADVTSDSDPYVRLTLKGGTGFVPKECKTQVIGKPPSFSSFPLLNLLNRE
jgi:hypothetical protein